jgi:hypothetical protein
MQLQGTARLDSTRFDKLAVLYVDVADVTGVAALADLHWLFVATIVTDEVVMLLHAYAVH